VLDLRLLSLHDDHQSRPRVASVAVPGELDDRADLLRGQRRSGTSETVRAQGRDRRRACIADDDHRAHLTTGRAARTRHAGMQARIHDIFTDPSI